MTESRYAGIDVAKDRVEVAISKDTSVKSFTNDGPGHEELAKLLWANEIALIVMEATGGDEFDLACALQAVGLRVAVINPRQARDFAKAMGYWAKTDRLDATVLAELARTIASPPQAERLVKPLADAACASSSSSSMRWCDRANPGMHRFIMLDCQDGCSAARTQRRAKPGL